MAGSYTTYLNISRSAQSAGGLFRATAAYASANFNPQADRDFFMIILHVIPTVNTEYGGPIEGIFTSSPILREQGCDREILSLDIPTDPWVRTCPIPVYPMGNADPNYIAWRRRIPWMRY